ncbi:hypothetical protein A3A68_02240 [Candidatus Saccharibacteria bacterium RIFCSPLOWO2_01_FULL_48_13]|nr:MAG: hypothetical protein A2884_02015 [Candidatus Saccharibacteria bacterium RIFCSPHIGHO2_01_FULL_48_12]OGL35203.1 MAG: hypothetical protein A3F38_02955 [Candidatus Saccharibacteria bacterium RIFCSPHIGHO2_12_FULL_48_21]OGL36748.1 MAG: hypothetical protein A3A68_02240 [Candidatus Saccharibacteria bacterium RIFCSPLOWO2_01_FULL_48_13]
MRTVLFVPGFRENLESRNYRSILNGFEAKGYKVKFVAINWSRNTVSDWVKEFDDMYQKYNPKKTILAGFSYGAIISLVSASKRSPSELWLFSLSARFHEDFPRLKKSTLRIMGKSKRRLEAFNNLRFYDLSKTVDCKTLIFVGEEEAKDDPALLERAKEAHKLIPNNQLILVSGAPHDVSNKKYIVAIEKAI